MGANPRIRGEMAEKAGGGTLESGLKSLSKMPIVALYFFFFLHGVHTLQVSEAHVESILRPCEFFL